LTETASPDVRFFETAAALRAWLADNHARATELHVGFRKTKSGKPSITLPQAVDQALAFGWIDGARHAIDDTAYRIRFTPRKATSIWSTVNRARYAELEAEGLIEPAGRAAFETSSARRSRYSYEGEAAVLTAEQTAQFRADPAAWMYFQSRTPSYRKAAVNWVTGAKQEKTRAQRLETLIETSAGEQPLPQFDSARYRKA